MTRHTIARWVLIVGICLCAAVGPATAEIWDASAQFSGANNPNGVWTYGYCPADISGGTVGFQAYANQVQMGDLLYWYTGSNPLLVEKGLLAYNPTGTDVNTGWALVPAHWLVYHPSGAADKPTVRWTSPVAGDVVVAVNVKTVTGTTDIHLFARNAQVWSANIDAGNPEASTEQTVTVGVGDFVEFVGGEGGNGYGGDGTAFTFVITAGVPGQITGVVTSSLPGNPVLPGVTVKLETGESTTTDDNGAYSFANVTSGDRTLTFSKAMYATLTHPITVPSGETVTYSPVLETSILNGTVTSSAAGNPPLAAVRVSLAGTDGEGVTDSAGHYEIQAPPATYTVSFTKSGYEAANVSQVLASGQTATLNQQVTFVKDIWDAGYDFQGKQNPHYVWTYGYIDGDGVFQPYTTGYSPPGGVPFFTWDVDTDSAIGGIATKNYAAAESARNGGLYPPMPSTSPHTLGMHPGETGSQATIRWTAPRDMIAQIHASFSGLAGLGTTTDCHVYLNQTPFYDTEVNGFVGTYAQNYKDSSGTTPIVDRWLTTRIAAGDTLDFAVGYGSDYAWANDLTGLIATIEPSNVAPGDVFGTVVSSAPGNPPIEGAKVATEDGRFWTLTDYGGGYYMTIPSGTGIKLIASKTAFASVEQTISLPEDGATPCDFILPSGQLSGFVTDSLTHEGLNGALIRTQDGAHSLFSTYDGSYSIDLVPGTYTFEVSLPGYIKQTAQVPVDGLTAKDFDLVPDPDFNADLTVDFQLGANPNGFWTYGSYYLDEFAPYEPFSAQPYQVVFPGKLMGLGDTASTIGLMLKNFTSENIVFYGGPVPANSVVFHPGATNYMPTARWTAPSDAKVLVTASFADASPQAAGGATTDGYVIKNGEVIGHGYVEHYQGIYSWSFAGMVDVLKGDNLDFALGFGSNGGYGSDLTIVDATIIKAPLAQDVPTIGNLQDPGLIGKYVRLTGKAAICDGAAFGDGFYIEEPDRTAGVGIVGAPNAASVLVGDRVTVTGVLSGKPGQLYIAADSLTRVAGTPLKPVGSINRSARTTSGLLAKVWGNVTFVDTSTTPSFFYIDDGSLLADGSGNVGLRVDISNLTTPDAARAVIAGLASGQLVSVTGVVGIESDRLTVRPRADADIDAAP